MTVGALRRTATDVEVDGFHPRVPLDLPHDCCDRLLTLLQKVEMAGVWPATATAALSSS